jgi:hypothetical protein
MVRVGIAVVLLTLLVPRAQEREIPWAGTWEEACKEAATRNVPIFLLFMKDGQAECNAVRTGTLTDKNLRAYLYEMAVPVVAHTADEGYCHEAITETDPETGKPIIRCPLYGGISCLEHDALHVKLAPEYKVTAYPKAFVLGPDGKPVTGTGRVMSSDAMEIMKKIRFVQKKLGKPMRRSLFDDAERKVADGRAHFENDDVRKAIKVLQRLVKDKKAPETFKEEARGVLNEINQAGMKRYGEAMELMEKDPDGGKKILRSLRKDYKGVEVAEKARQTLRDLEE